MLRLNMEVKITPNVSETKKRVEMHICVAFLWAEVQHGLIFKL